MASHQWWRGDVAVCVREPEMFAIYIGAEDWREAPQIGDVAMVTGVVHSAAGDVALVFDRFGLAAWRPSAFTRVADTREWTAWEDKFEAAMAEFWSDFDLQLKRFPWRDRGGAN